MKKLFLLVLFPVVLFSGCSDDDGEDTFCWSCRYNADVLDEDEEYHTVSKCDYTSDAINDFMDQFRELNPDGQIRCNKE